MKLWKRWVTLTSATEDPTSVALFRILMGLCVLLTVGSVIAADLVPVIWVDKAFGGVRRLQGNWLVRLLGGPTPTVIWSLVAVCLASATALTAGVGSRMSALITLFTTQALVDINGYAGGSYDQLLQNGLWLCVITPSGASLSVDAWRRTGSFVDPTPIGRWARLLIAFQIVLVYWTTGLQKLSAYWTPGGDFSALYYILQQPSWQHTDMRWLAYVFPLTQLGTAATWFWEVLAPLWLLAVHWADRKGWRGRFAQSRWVFFALGIIFHVLILLTMNVGPFGPISMAFYVAMVRPERLYGLLTRLVARVRPSTTTA